MDPFLTVLTTSKRKQCLSCGDIAALVSDTDYDHLCLERPRKHSATAICPSIHPRRFLRQKSPPAHSVHRIKSRSCEELVNNVDCRLAEIKNALAIFREQDIDFRKRMHSLSNSIDDLASSHSSLASEDSTASDPVVFANDKEDQSIENKINDISGSFSSDVLNCIPTIAITCHMARQTSEPTLRK